MKITEIKPTVPQHHCVSNGSLIGTIIKVSGHWHFISREQQIIGADDLMTIASKIDELEEKDE